MCPTHHDSRDKLGQFLLAAGGVYNYQTIIIILRGIYIPEGSQDVLQLERGVADTQYSTGQLCRGRGLASVGGASSLANQSGRSCEP